MFDNLTKEEKPNLTPRQREIYEFLKDKILNRGYGPTVREIGAEFGIRSPNGVMCHLKALEKKGLITRESHMSRAIQLSESPNQRMTLPLAGVISAGQPLQSESQNERIDFSPLLDAETHLCLRVRGDSMASEQISEGDYVVVNKQSEFEDGDMIVAVVNGQESTIRRGYREGDRFRLESSSVGVAPIYPAKMEVLGIVVGVIRKY